MNINKLLLCGSIFISSFSFAAMDTSSDSRKRPADSQDETRNVRQRTGSASDDMMLLSSADAGNEELVKAALDRGADINAVGLADGFSALHIASKKNNENIVKFLIEKGASVKAKSAVNGATALHVAAHNNRPSIVKLLIEKGAVKEERDNRGETALKLAVKNRSADALPVLLSYGVEVPGVLKATVDSQLKSALGIVPGKHHVISNIILGNKLPLEVMLDNTAIAQDHGINERDKNGMTALMWAAARNDLTMVKMVLTYGKNYNCIDALQEDNIQRTALIIAQDGSNKEIAQEIYNYLEPIRKKYFQDILDYTPMPVVISNVIIAYLCGEINKK